MYGGPYMTYTWIMYSSATSACVATYMTYTCPIWRVMYNHVYTQALQLQALQVIVPLRTYHCTKGTYPTYICHGMSARYDLRCQTNQEMAATELDFDYNAGSAALAGTLRTRAHNGMPARRPAVIRESR